MRISLTSRGALALLTTCLSSTLPAAVRAADSDVRVNSVGYLTARAKGVSVLGGAATTFTVRRTADGSSAFDGTLPAPSADPGTNDMVAQGDFSALAETGRFYVDVPGVGRSVDFAIGDDVYRRPFVAAMLGFYGWRCGTSVSFAFSGDSFGHGACHLGDGHLDYLGQAGAMRDGKGGWHDAGDFGKYTGNAGFTLGMLLSAFERHPGGLAQAPLPLPEAGGALPDYLDELRWELEWMLKMIYGADDGRVSHKLTALGFEGFVAPEDDLQTRYFVPFSSAATADFVAALAQASRLYRPYDADFADRCLAAARTAYAVLTANTANTPPDQTAFSTGGYTTSDPDDRLWAAAEMWETTGEDAPLADVEARINAVSATATLVAADFDWGSVRNLGLFTYLLSARDGRTQAVVDRVRASAMTAADAIVTAHDASRYGRGVANYYWGSNGSVARTAMLLAVANRLSGDARYLDVAADQLALPVRSQPLQPFAGHGPGHRPAASSRTTARRRRTRSRTRIPACSSAAAPPPPPGWTIRTCTWSTRSPSTGTARWSTRWRCSCPRARGRRRNREIDAGAGGDAGGGSDAGPIADASTDVFGGLPTRRGGCSCAFSPGTTPAQGSWIAWALLGLLVTRARRSGR